MKQLIYVPVHIDGKEENLPKEEGEYIFGWDKWDGEVSGISMLLFSPNDFVDEFKIYNWWLKPIELPDEKEIKINADEYEKKASCGAWNGTYVNEDFVAGANWFKSQILKK